MIKNIYLEVMKIVEQYYNLGVCDILDSKREKCADARYVLIHFLSQKMTDAEISDLTGLPRSSVNHIRNHRRTFKYAVRVAVADIAGSLAKDAIWNMVF